MGASLWDHEALDGPRLLSDAAQRESGDGNEPDCVGLQSKQVLNLMGTHKLIAALRQPGQDPARSHPGSPLERDEDLPDPLFASNAAALGQVRCVVAHRQRVAVQGIDPLPRLPRGVV